MEEFKDMETPFEDIYNVYNDMRLKEFENNEKIIKRRLMGEFATLKGGTKARVKSTISYDKEINAALDILADEGDYKNILGYKGN